MRRLTIEKRKLLRERFETHKNVRVRQLSLSVCAKIFKVAAFICKRF